MARRTAGAGDGSIAGTADIVIVGAGHNSLVSAAYLAAAGLEVIVLEARDVIGGNTVTEELTLPGYRHDSCSSAHVLLQSNPLIRDDELDLGRYGLSYTHPDPAVVMRLRDGSSLVMHRDPSATAKEIAVRSARDAQAYLRLHEEWETDLKAPHGRWNAGTLDPRARADDRRYAELRERSAFEVVHDRFVDDGVRDFLLWLSFATIQRPDRAGTGLLPFAITTGRSRFGWAVPIGGSGMLPQALARLVEDRGGSVLTGRPVEAVLVVDGRASGVRCAGGEVYAARRAVVSSAHVARLADMIEGAAAPAAALAANRAWRPGLTLFAVHLALRAGVRYPIPGGRSVEAVAGGLGSVAGLTEQIRAFDRGETYAADPWILVVCPNAVDGTRAPDGHATCKLLTIAPYRLAGGRDWGVERERFAAALVTHAAAQVDGLDEASVLAVRPESPIDLERRNPHNAGGSCHGGEFVADDGTTVPGWSDAALLPGLYPTGATVHPGGSVSGRPGRNTARRVLIELGMDPAKVMGDE
ncbi:phytoene desaturase family protein [Actinomadura sp. HBU206391]|uniref:phytoene desaturase family protein n=1 Tax=Actinomadura sp. HBU206391 TaxID=2731692 RepID=UPI0016509550|nr:NAD(P)/FAD-dependent oxidoreductase [Actinomadura sp. HBU206391]MBC6462566.1 NAD(P)/FAD-dependent oxidoreductase [Actinomadura sp. HBU206391]